MRERAVACARSARASDDQTATSRTTLILVRPPKFRILADYAAIDLEGKWVARLSWSPRQREGTLTTRVSRAPLAAADIAGNRS